ncbi:MAG: DUF2490 domain-containing protein [Spirosomataceae bacterium]
MYKYIPFLFLFVAKTASAQLVHANDLIWTRYLVQSNGKSKHYLIGEIDNRIQSKFGVGKRNQTIFHLHQHFKIHESLDVAVGTSYSNVVRYSPSKKEEVTMSEVRLFEELNTKHLEKDNSIIQSRIRVEQRYFPKEYIGDTQEKLPIQSRVRYQLQFSQRLNKHLLLKASNEIMFHAGGWVDYLRMDQNRVYMAARTQFTPSLAVEAGYLWIINQGIEVTSPMKETDILRFTLHHSLASKNK